jgi:hypothetical protein
MASSDPKRELLRHTLATLAYRGARTIRHAPAGFDNFHRLAGSRAGFWRTWPT